ncbi:hypothetical protein [Alkaliphilus peptidifermentans]|uniref:Uncharacterized protein n=1 Tax=Alkaliphilus peptidifermentans DSM 18978 TaxID=1120976 RepID=A0A1G5LGB1_9FIRM|nr:hypothetical protein [Alkaliphilus peptidifermentans]SCZ11872.1 hypothetical protein SAMN03080606_04390 [Alkaliphilus peptidifermentans DSM 18978]
MKIKKGQRLKEVQKVTEGSTRLTLVTLTMTFFFFLLINFIKQMNQSGYKVSTESTLVYPVDFYTIPVLITSLLFVLFFAIRYCVHEFHTFVNFINISEMKEYEERANNSFKSFLINFKEQLVIIAISLTLFSTIYGMNSKLNFFLFLGSVITVLLLVLIIEIRTWEIKIKKVGYMRRNFNYIFENGFMYLFKLIIFGLCFLILIQLQSRYVFNEYFSGYVIEFISGESPVISIIARFNVSEDLEILIHDKHENAQKIEKCYYSIKSAHFVKEKNELETSVGLFGVKNDYYYDLKSGFEKYHLLIPIDNYLNEGMNRVEISFSNKRQSILIVNYIYWDMVSGEFIESIIENM